MTEEEQRQLQIRQAKIKRELWIRGNLEWKFHEGQAEIYKQLQTLPPSTREILLFISRRWGKSFFVVLMAIMECLKGKGRQVFIVGPTIKHTTAIVLPLINEIIKDAPDNLIKRTKSDKTWTIGSSTLFIGGFDTAVETFRGLKADAIFLEESGLANADEYEYVLNSVLRPTLMHSKGKIYHATTPAKAVDHPLHTITMPKTKLTNSFFRYSIESNPLLTREDIEEEIAAIGGRESVHTKRELFCELVKDATSLVVPEFDKKYVFDNIKLPRHTYWLTSIDFGGSRDKTSLLCGFYDFERAKVVIKGSMLLDPNTGTDIVIAKCQELEQTVGTYWKDGERRVCDAAGQTHVDIRRLNFKCFLPLKGRDSVEEGINALRVAFLQGKIEIDSACKDLITTLEHGSWNDQRTDFKRTKELGHCDAIASLVYFFRHLDTHTNPFPVHEGMHRHTHYLPEVKRDTSTEEALNTAFTL